MINLGPSDGSTSTERNDLLDGLDELPDSKRGGGGRARPLMACCSRRPRSPQKGRPIGSMIPASGPGAAPTPNPPMPRLTPAQSPLRARPMRSLQQAPPRSPGYAQSFMATAPLWGRCGKDLSIDDTGDLVTFARKRRGSVVNAANNGTHCGVAVCDNVLLRAGKNSACFKLVKTKQSNIMIGVGRPVLALEGEPVSDFWGIYLRDSNLGGGSLWHMGHQYPWDGMQGAMKGDEITIIMDSELGSLEVLKNGARLGVACEGLEGDLCWALALWDPGDRVRLSDPTINTDPVIIAIETPARASAAAEVSAAAAAGDRGGGGGFRDSEPIHLLPFDED